MKMPTHHLIGRLVFLLAAFLPRTSDAGSVYATWQGTMTDTVEEFVNGVESGPYITVSPDALLTMEWTGSAGSGSVDFNVFLYGPFYPTPVGDPFGPQSASFGGDVFAGGPGGFTQEFNLTTTYAYIDPEGVIVGGSATADFTYVGVINQNPYAYTTISIFESFQGTSVPEPSTIVLMGIGFLTTLIFSRRPGIPIRAFRARQGRAERR
jgi:hypothetical protein